MGIGSVFYLLRDANRNNPATLLLMDLQAVLTQIDNEIARLQQAKDLLTGSKSGKLKLPANLKASATTKTSGAAKKPVKRQLSPDAIARIRAAQKRRWAKAKKAAN